MARHKMMSRWTRQQLSLMFDYACNSWMTVGARVSMYDAQAALPADVVRHQPTQAESRQFEMWVAEETGMDQQAEPAAQEAAPVEAPQPPQETEAFKPTESQFIKQLAKEIAVQLIALRVAEPEPQPAPAPPAELPGPVVEWPKAANKRLPVIGVIGLLSQNNWTIEKEFEGRAKIRACTTDAANGTIRSIASGSDAVIACTGIMSHTKMAVIKKAVPIYIPLIRMKGSPTSVIEAINEILTALEKTPTATQSPAVPA